MEYELCMQAGRDNVTSLPSLSYLFTSKNMSILRVNNLDIFTSLPFLYLEDSPSPRLVVPAVVSYERWNATGLLMSISPCEASSWQAENWTDEHYQLMLPSLDWRQWLQCGTGQLTRKRARVAVLRPHNGPRLGWPFLGILVLFPPRLEAILANCIA